ncbi:DUF3696 domain-containing protein [Rhodococcus sp. BH2-1]|nr:DUF3696 domain-containing protein [Rhodococcus sp. BH2-1]
MYALLRKISYLGPLRSLPSSTYQISPEAPTAVGRDGQFSCELLLRSKNKAVLKEVNSWLERLGYGKLKFQEHRDEFFQVLIQPAESTFPVNIAHTGVGLSQLLPILVQGCLTEQDDTFIVQQPEIHLNPAQQCLIADFLIERTLRGTRTIIETHSEHLLLRLRRRIAEGQISANDVAIYYCDNENGNSTVDRVHIGQKAELERRDWPSGFFEEQLQDSIKLALAQARA